MWLSTLLPGRSAGKSTSSAVGSASAADGVGDDMQAIRDHLRAVGSGIGVGLGALLTGLGYTQIHKLFPLPAGHGYFAVLAFACSAAALIGAAILVGRFYAAQRRVPVSTDRDRPPPQAWLVKLLLMVVASNRSPDGLTSDECARRDRVYDQSARDEGAHTLKALELRAYRMARIGRKVGDERGAGLVKESERLLDAVDEALGQGAAAVLERRAEQAFSGWFTRIPALLTIAGIIGIFGLADWSQGQRELVAVGKQCGEAKAAIAACGRFGATTAPSVPAVGTAWLNGYREVVSAKKIIGYRVYGGGSRRKGIWVTTTPVPNEGTARIGLALPSQNAARCLVRVTIPPGTAVRLGHVGPAAGHPGGASQIEILGGLDTIGYGTDRALPPSARPCP